MSFGRPRFTKNEMLELDAWWAWRIMKAKEEGRWPPRWKPAKRNKRWRNK